MAASGSGEIAMEYRGESINQQRSWRRHGVPTKNKVGEKIGEEEGKAAAAAYVAGSSVSMAWRVRK